jgi:hypothetical protein
LDDLLRPLAGFTDFLAEQAASRIRDRVRRFELLRPVAEDNISFIDEYLRQHLTDPKTETLRAHKAAIEKAGKANAIEDGSVEALSQDNDAFKAFVTNSHLLDEYNTIISAGRTSEPPQATIDQLKTEKNKFAIEGPDGDLVLAFNASPSAPSIAKDITGKLVFQTGRVSLCTAQRSMDEDRTRLLERLFRQLGADEIKRLSECDFSLVPTQTDIVAFQRGELRKQRPNYVIGLLDRINDNTLREYRVITESEYNREMQDRRALQLQIAKEVEDNRREGFGVLTVTDAAIPVCIVISDSVAQKGLRELLSRDKELISRRLRFEWSMEESTRGNAFIALSRMQCGYAAGNAASLRDLMVPLRRDDKTYEFAPLWYSTDSVIAAGTEALKREEQSKIDKENKKKIDEALGGQNKRQKENIERELREQNGPRARGLRDQIQSLIKQAADKPLAETPRRAKETERWFPSFSAWLNKRFDEQWETDEVSSDIVDYGKVQWNGRALDGIIIETTITQRNRIKGARQTYRFRFGLVDDAEFMMKRDLFDVETGSSDRAIAYWKTRRDFISLWNAP